MRFLILAASLLALASATPCVSAIEKAIDSVPNFPAEPSDDLAKPESEFPSDELPIEPTFTIRVDINFGAYVCLSCPGPSPIDYMPKAVEFLGTEFTSSDFYSRIAIVGSKPYPEPILTKPLLPFALIPRKLRIAPSGEVFYE